MSAGLRNMEAVSKAEIIFTGATQKMMIAAVSADRQKIPSRRNSDTEKFRAYSGTNGANYGTVVISLVFSSSNILGFSSCVPFLAFSLYVPIWGINKLLCIILSG